MHHFDTYVSGIGPGVIAAIVIGKSFVVIDKLRNYVYPCRRITYCHFKICLAATIGKKSTQHVKLHLSFWNINFFTQLQVN